MTQPTQPRAQQQGDPSLTPRRRWAFWLGVALCGVAVGGCAKSSVGPAQTGPAAKVVFTVQPSNAVAGAVNTPAVQVAVQDAQGNTVTTATTSITLAIGTNPASGTLAGTKTVAAASGVATFSTLSLNMVGTGYTLTATATGLTGATSNAFNIGVGAAAKLVFTVQPSSAAAGAANSPAMQVAVQDAQGNPVTTATTSITLAIGTNPGSGTLAGTTTVAAVNGVATFANLSINNPGTGYTLTASATGLMGATSNAFNITLSVGPAAKLVFTAQPSTAAAGAAITPAVQVAVQDAQGNSVTTATTSITVAIGTNPASGTLSGTTTVAAVNGVATFANLNINNPGTGYTLTASATNLTGASSSGFNLTAPITAGSLRLSVAVYGACGVTTGGAAYCWGPNGYGELGNGTTTSSAIPVAVSGGLSFATVSANFESTCGVTTGGAAYCWGVNQQGELGNGSTTGPQTCVNIGESYPCSLTPVAVSGGLSFATVSAGYLHACGVTTGGAAYCWGYNYDGELGNGSNTGPQVCAYEPCSTTPVAVSGGLSFATVSAGGGFTCGVTTGGAAYCWGIDGFSFTDNLTPVPVSGGLTFAALNAGNDHTCAVTPSGAAYCWGNNYAGELGDGSTTASATPVAVSGGLSFANVSAGETHTCGVTTGGAAYCWGDNTYGKLGNGTTTSSATPVAVSGGLSFATVSAGLGSSCGVTTGGAAYCWGGGGLGNGSTSYSLTPVAVSGGLSF